MNKTLPTRVIERSGLESVDEATKACAAVSGTPQGNPLSMAKLAGRMPMSAGMRLRGVTHGGRLARR